MFVIWGPESSHQAALTRRFCHQLRSPKVSRHFGCHKDKPDFLSAPGNCTIVKNKPNSCWLLTVLHLNRLAMKLWQIDLYISCSWKLFASRNFPKHHCKKPNLSAVKFVVKIGSFLMYLLHSSKDGIPGIRILCRNASSHWKHPTQPHNITIALCQTLQWPLIRNRLAFRSVPEQETCSDCVFRNPRICLGAFGDE